MSSTATFEEMFQSRLNEIEAIAKKKGFTITHVCRASGISRATPDRWRTATPLSITLLDKMMEAVTSAEPAN